MSPLFLNKSNANVQLFLFSDHIFLALYNYIIINDGDCGVFLSLQIMFKDIIILSLVCYLVYKLFSRFIIPIVRITNTANDHMNRMQEQMREMDRKMNEPAAATKQRVKKEGDYIDYEEVR